MIRKREKVMWLCYGIVLIFLFLLSSTDLIIKETKPQIYPISIIIEDTQDDNYVNYRKGMDRAAIELNVDISFITMYDSNDQEQQLELIVREQHDGAKALIVMPVDENAVEEALVNKRVSAPLVLVNSELPRDRISAVVSTDFYEMGQQLATQVAERVEDGMDIYLFTGEHDNTVIRHFENGVRAGLDDTVGEIYKISEAQDDEFRKTIESLVYPGDKKGIIIALDQSSLEKTARILQDSSVYQEHVVGLYGRGTNIPLLNYLDKGIISGICVTDDFSAGYISVKKAVEAIDNQLQQEQTILESYYIEKKDLRNPQYEKMLYPIE